MHRGIEESEARMEQWTTHTMDQKVQAVNKHLDAFEWIVLERPSPTDDVTTLRKVVESLRVDLTALLVPSKTKPESAPMSSTDNTVEDALLKDEVLLPVYSCHAGKRPSSSRISDDTEAGRTRKREHQNSQAARMAFIVDQGTCQQRVREVGVGASSSMSTIDGVARVDVHTTDGAVIVGDSTTEGDVIVDVGTTEVT
ncbi:hypothetical protein R3W88_024486 [Solanum pinnatisectum]|uniref:Integrase core domain containing protein n=1 Tax=Solanum pinnatisectum TaxID=50273 RepID=A0AAV9M0B4_9SOLN|nr:hypothetical protein R3W88_024486 [Solanum pinnatisectum]